MLRAAIVPLCLLMFTLFKCTISYLDDQDTRHAILGAVTCRFIFFKFQYIFFKTIITTPS